MEYKAYIPQKPQHKKFTTCPQITIFIMIAIYSCLNFWIYYFSNNKAITNLRIVLFITVPLIILIAIEVNITLGICLKKYLCYFIGLILSFIGAIIYTLLGLIFTIVDYKNEKVIRASIIAFSIPEWIITLILFIYKKELRKIIGFKEKNEKDAAQQQKEQQEPLVA